MGKTRVIFNLNGENTVAEVDRNTSLLDYLRSVGLKGAKAGCNTGHCGACTVIVDGRATRSCITKMPNVEGKNVLTIEGISSEGELHPIQKAYLDVGAVQCGFCTPGMVMATKALLDANLDPTREEIYKALKHNYCRCTGYVKIIEAVELAAARMRGENPTVAEIKTMERTTIVQSNQEHDVTTSKGKFVGKAIWDTDGVAKAKGTLVFTDDCEMPGMLYGAFVWAGIPHAKILNIDTKKAEELPGVVRVLTYNDVPGKNTFGCYYPEQPVFCKDQVNFVRDMVALVVAESVKIAREGAKLVDVEYEELEGIFTIDDAVKKDNVMGEIVHQIGDLNSVIEEDLVVVKGTYNIEKVEHGYLEPESAIGSWTEGGDIQVIACTQSPFEIRSMLAPILNMPEEKISVVGSHLGGGFGSKCDSTIEAAAAVAAYNLNRPVKITLTREESMSLSTKRHAFRNIYKLGVSRNGEICYLDVNMISDAGPYKMLSVDVMEQACIFSGGPYKVPNAHIRGKVMRTNNMNGGAFRGFGINQPAISIETMLDEVAEKLKMDPFEIRKINALRVGDLTITGEKLKHSVGIYDTIVQCEKATKKALKEYEGKYPKGNKVLGVGVASGYKNVGLGKGYTDDGGCIMTLMPNGRVEMRLSGVDMGQGFRTAMLQLAAEALDMDITNFDIISGDTSLTLKHAQAVSERQTLNTGRAVLEAAHLLKEKLEDEPWQPGKTRTASYRHIASRTYSLKDTEGKLAAGEDYKNYPSYAYLTHSAIIELDRETGEIKVLKVISANDVGKAINPHIIEGQVEGSCSMGIGYAHTESYPTVNGIPVVKYFNQLGLPTIDETPEYEIILVEDPEPEGPFGAKGIAEVSTVPITPAVINAIYSAIGVRIRKIPASKECILTAIKGKS